MSIFRVLGVPSPRLLTLPLPHIPVIRLLRIDVPPMRPYPGSRGL